MLARDRLSLRTIVIFATIFNLNAVGSLSRNDSWRAGEGDTGGGKFIKVFRFFRFLVKIF